MSDKQFDDMIDEIRYIAKLAMVLACGWGALIVVLLFHFKYD